MLLLLFALSFGFSHAQVSGYAFSQSSGTFTPVTGGTVLATATANSSGAASLDSGNWPVTLPFAFSFNGKSYTELNVNANGFVTFGTTTTTVSSPISSSTAYEGAISAFGKDLNSVFDIAGVTGDVRWETVGTAPNREVVIQWSNFRTNYSISTSVAYTMSFQIRLKETTNVISTVYSNGSYLIGSSSQSGTAQIGLRGTTNSDYNNRTNGISVAFINSSAGTSSSNSQAYNSVTDPPGMPTAGLTYTWTPPACYWVTGAVTVSVNSATSLDVSWNASSSAPSNYEVYYSTVNTAPTATTVLNAANSVTASTNSATVTGLEPGTNYYVWVRSRCSASDVSAWSAANGTAFTLCAPVTTLFENFDSYATGSTVPNCWERIVPAATPGSQTITSTSPASGTRNIYQNATSTQIPVTVVLPEFSNINAGTHWLKFKARVSSGAPGTLEVGYVTDPANAATFTLLTALSITNTSYSTGADYTVSVPTTVPTGARLAIRNAADGKSYYWDNVSWEAVPTCYAPTSASISAVLSTSASMAWVAPATVPSNDYQIYYSTVNTAPTASTVLDATNSVVGTGTSAMLTNLTPSTNYYVWIRGNCGGSDVSTWLQVGSFLTACATITPYYANDFATFPGACWSQASGGSPAGGPTGTSAVWVEDGFLNSGSVGAARINLYTTDRTGWLISPDFDLSAGGYRVKFDYGITEFSGSAASAMGSDDIVQFAVSSDGGTTWTVLQTWNAANAPSNSLNTYNYTLTGYTGTNVKFAVYATDGSVNDPEDYNFYVDNFVVETVPTCDVPTSVNMTGASLNTVTLAWNAPSVAPANGYTVYYSAVNTAPTGSTVLDATNSLAVSGNAATVSGLSANTTYYVWVRSECGPSNVSLWTGPTSVYTGACQPTGSSYYIDELSSTGGITNINYTGSSTVTGGYRDLTATHRIANHETTTTAVTVSGGGSSTYGFAIWVDWNNNLQFEAAERMYVTSGYSNTTAASITVPAGTPVGDYRARVQMNYNNTAPSDPCALAINGEHIDFTFEVTVPPSCLAPVGVNVNPLTATSATLTWTAPPTAPANGYEYYISATNTTPTSGTPTTNTSVDAGVLTPESTYYYWVRSMCAGSESAWVTGSFTTPMMPPVNDNCANATVLTPGATFAQNAQVGTFVGGTTDGSVPTCQSNANSNVWYTVTVPASGSITIESDAVTGSTITDTVIQVFSGSCGSLVAVTGGCDDDSGNGTFSQVNLTGQTPGSTLYVSVWRYSTSQAQGQFQISAFDGSLNTGEVALNDEKVTVYPNPFTDIVNITDVKDLKLLTVIDMSGRMVKSISNPGRQVNLSELKAGLYILKLDYQDGTSKSVKAIKK